MDTARSKIEEEVIFLKAITDLIDQMVNYSVFEVVGESPNANILFHTAAHQRLFNILLVDLLSSSDKRLVGRKLPYLDALRNICDQPSFGDSAIHDLRPATQAFVDWLAVKPTVPVWLPSADLQVQLTLPHSTFIRICGNLSKHSILRRSRPAIELRKLLAEAGASLTLDGAVLALEDFYERFHSDIFNYHASAIAEMLNEIRWGVHQYLLSEYHRSYVYEGGRYHKYHFRYPEGVKADLARSLYWDLMNDVRRGPIVKKFTTWRYLRLRY